MKILIIGNIASGKSTLAKKLSKQMNIKHYEIDSIVHDDTLHIRRSLPQQLHLIHMINKNNDWIIEGVLRSDLDILLELADKIIYLEISSYIQRMRILTRFIKQKLKMEKANYKPTFHMLKNMYKWSNHFDKSQLKQRLKPYQYKLEIIHYHRSFQNKKEN